MDFDLQNNPRQTMDSDLLKTPQFSAGGEVAAFITSCGILQKSLEEICSVNNNVDYFLKENEGVAYVTFPSFSMEDFNVTGSRYGECDIKNEKIFYACLKGDTDKPALVHEGALNRFRRILERSDFEKKMKALKAQTIIFVGHSMGGAVATLATLCNLQKRVRGKSYFCITFGSPLVGNAILGEAIGVQDWIGNFFHVVSNYDIVPRMLLAPFDSIVEHLNAITPHWGSGIGTDSVAVTHPSITSLREKVLQCSSNIANNYPGESSLTSPYRPFGTYMFCSTQGAACIEDPEAVLTMLHFTMQGIPFDQLAGTCASDHTGYGQMLEAVTDALLNATPIANFATDSFEMGIKLELKAMAVEAQELSHAYVELRKAGERKNAQDMNNEKLNEELSKMQSYMAEVEWYKAVCKTRSGYYDSFKQQGEKKDQEVNLARIKLERFWKEEIVEKEEKHVLPSDFRSRNKWINAGTAYRRLVEPLDIAYHYGPKKDTKSYLSDGVRPHHHKVLEKWMKEKEQTRAAAEKDQQTRGDREKKPRTKFASLTVDSCFWARIEDASQALTNILQQKDPHPNMNAVVLESRQFEQYIWDMIRDKSISDEVFLKGSSFMSWWEEYIRFRSWSQQQLPKFTSSSPLFSFMQNEKWK